ncbi:Cytochrome P450 CYP301 [Frankliniella occidentalis]|uniref:Probable cytochrome P450 301a1, mitochondrial n=1 Tax=Frankliniella occidentalis TaxID=133901 RepID=A0A9C6UBC4_FRAOC|nr:probable cytochrome P450 301a1, mitochondrial [Frankliniella occidentalis]KAE8745657.1 Cytochrome P450 CYP301 [Frankliniella occidentalis]
MAVRGLRGMLRSGVRPRSSTTATAPLCPREAEVHDADPVAVDGLPYEQMPGPRPLPLIGNTWRLLPVVGQYQVSDLARVSALLHEQYGDCVKLSNLVGRPDLVFVFDADETERVYRHEGPTPFRPAMPCLVSYKSDVRKDFFGYLAGVVGVHGEAWREFRSRVQRPCLQPKTVRSYIGPIEDVTDCFLQRMQDMRDDRGEMPADFDNEIHKWSLECIGRVALDTRLGCLDPNLPPDSEPQKIIDAAKFALRNVAVLELKFPFWRYIPTPLWTHYVNNMNFFVEVCTKHIDRAMERLATKEDGELSVVERILAEQTDRKLAYVLALDLILVGIDTISMAVCSILYQLATRPEVQDKMFAELERVLPDPDTPLTARHLDQLAYTKGFVKEVLRMYSTVIGNGRTLTQDMTICGYRIPKGVQLVFPTVVTGNMPRYAGRADEFLPERWIKGHDASLDVHPFASLPYGYGARMCLGRRFADLEMHVLLAKLVRKFRLEYHHRPLDYQVTFMYAPEGELRFKLVER